MIVTDGASLLLGHATGSPRWDIPKGMANADEPFDIAASRELLEETGLHVDAGALRLLGRFAYMPAKDLVLFAWHPAHMPDPAVLRCTSLIDKPAKPGLPSKHKPAKPGLAGRPELDRFGLFAPEAAMQLVGRNLARVLGEVWPMASKAR